MKYAGNIKQHDINFIHGSHWSDINNSDFVLPDSNIIAMNLTDKPVSHMRGPFKKQSNNRVRNISRNWATVSGDIVCDYMIYHWQDDSTPMKDHISKSQYLMRDQSSSNELDFPTQFLLERVVIICWDTDSSVLTPWTNIQQGLCWGLDVSLHGNAFGAISCTVTILTTRKTG